MEFIKQTKHRFTLQLLVISSYKVFFRSIHFRFFQWSEVYSYDMFETRFTAEGLMNPEVGSDYRSQVITKKLAKNVT